MKVHHIGYLVKNIYDSIEMFGVLGYQVSEVNRNENRGVDICFINNGEYNIELVSPYRENSDVADMIKKHPNQGYHICYESENIQEDIKQLKKEGFIPISNITSAPSINNSDVAFLHQSSIGLIELVKLKEKKEQ